MIRSVTRDDIPAFHAVMMQAGMDARSSWSRTSPQDLEQSLFAKGAGGFLYVTDGGEVVGCVGYRPDGENTLTLNKLATLPSARGQGIGRQLVERVEAQARHAAFERVLLAVSQYNLEVIPFYERLGYVQTAEAYAFANPTSPKPVVFVKKLGEFTQQRLLEIEIERLKAMKQANHEPAIIIKAFDMSLFKTRVPFIFAMTQVFGIHIREARDLLAARESPNEYLNNVFNRCIEKPLFNRANAGDEQ